MTSSEKQDRQIRIQYITAIFIMVVCIAVSLVTCMDQGYLTLRPEYVRDVSIDVLAQILCGVLIFSLSKDKPWDRQNRSLFRMVFVLAILFFIDQASAFTEGHPQTAAVVRAINTLDLFLETMLVYCYYVYVREELQLAGESVKKLNLICRVILVIDLLQDVLNYWFGYFFTVNAAGEFVNGPMMRYEELTSFLLYFVILIVMTREKNHTWSEKRILLTFLIFPLLAHTYGFASLSFEFMYPAYFVSVMIIYINVFATRSARLIEQEALLEKQNTQLMISQIQPHFLYNVLTTISNLCVTDPEEAEETTILFSQYLRTNLDSLRNTEPVPFGMELQHIRTYVELEKKRFGDKLNVTYDAQATGFLVPSLGLQPIVENSVKHGIRGKETPGHLLIASREVEGGYEVVIQDDGVGFDPNGPMPQDGRSHVGMLNVKTRLQKMCHAEMTIESSPGNGCKTTIFFPEEDE